MMIHVSFSFSHRWSFVDSYGLTFLCGRVGSDEGGDYSLSSLEVFVASVRCTCRYFARVQENSGGREKKADLRRGRTPSVRTLGESSTGECACNTGKY